MHLVDKWDFVAFSVGGSEVDLGLTLWEQRKQTDTRGGRKRKLVQPKLWSQRAQKRAYKARQHQQRLLGGTRVAHGRVLRVLSLCDGCSATSLVLQRLASQLGIAFDVTVVEWDVACQKFVAWKFPGLTPGWSHDIVDWADTAFKPE